MFHLFLLAAASCSTAALIGTFEPARLLLGLLALKRALPEDVPAVTEALSKWRSHSRSKRK